MKTTAVGDIAASPKRETHGPSTGLYNRCMPFINTVYTAQVTIVSPGGLGTDGYGSRVR